tara:strand:+ start:531 stop:725 length:195 start_codon:yes stop_codon:yes gene_type:complete
MIENCKQKSDPVVVSSPPRVLVFCCDRLMRPNDHKQQIGQAARKRSTVFCQHFLRGKKPVKRGA